MLSSKFVGVAGTIRAKMSYFDDVMKSGGISEEDTEKIREIVIDENNPLEVSRAVEYYFCYVKSGCSKELEIEAV